MSLRACRARLVAVAAIMATLGVVAVARAQTPAGAQTPPNPQTPASAPAVPSQPPIDPGLRADIARLLEITGSSKIGLQTAELIAGQALEALKKRYPDMPTRVTEVAREVFQQEFAKAFDGPGNLNEELARVYARHFSRQDIQGLIAFYETDLGKKFVAEMPQLARDSAMAGQRWAQERTPAILATLEARLRAEGLIK